MSPKVRKIVDAVRSNIHRRLSLEDLAGLVSLSRSHLCHSFKAEMGMSVGQYLKYIRMQRAGELLETTRLSVKEVAAAVGMFDQSHFVRAFKKSHGLTPTQFREKRTSFQKS